MKLLSKMLLINWHYFGHSEIEFKMLNFLTGQNAVGKSTLIDALQVVMLGETKSYLFNKAANDKSERTLIGYLKGELGDDGGTGYRYLREGDFNAYIVLEFYDTVKDTYFISGVIFDVYGDATEKHSYFIADCPIPQSQFLKKDIPFNRNDLKSYLKTETGNRFSFFETQNTYRLHLMGKCGNIKHKFFSLFKKAVPFTPISDIEKFITEYITDIKGKPNVEEMQHNLRYYKRLEKDAVAIQDRIIRLDTINKNYGDWQNKKRLQVTHEFLSSLGREQKLRNQLDDLSESVKKLEIKRDQILENIKLLDFEKQKFEQRREELITEKSNSDIQKKLIDIDQKLVIENAKLVKMMAQLDETVNHLGEIAKDFIKYIGDDAPEPILECVSYFNNLHRSKVTEASSGKLFQLNEFLEKRQSEYQNQLFDANKLLSTVENDIAQWQQTLDNLKKGIKNYPVDVVNLVSHLNAAGLNKVEILADVIDVSDERWKNAIEGYLHTQKFYLLVEESAYSKALEVYNSIRTGMPIYNTGLIDVEKIKVKNSRRDNNSLANYITSEHSGAKLYIDFILGKVIGCNDLNELRAHAVSITDTCMLYQNFVARQLDPNRWKIPYIGRKAIEEQIKLIEKQLEEAKLNRTTLTKEIELLVEKCKIKSLSKLELNMHLERLMSISDILIANDEISKLSKEKEGLDLTYLLKLEDQLREVKMQLEKCAEHTKQLLESKGSIVESLRHIEEVELPSIEAVHVQCVQAMKNPLYDEIRIDAKNRFEKLINEQSVESIEVNFARSSKAAGTDSVNMKAVLIKNREDYNRIFHMSHDANSAENEVYELAYKELNDNKLPDYLQKIKLAQEKTSEQFKDEFLAKLKSNFDTVFEQIKELNAAIKDSPFGTDNYKFEVKPKSEMRLYYDMIMDDLLMSDNMSIMSYAFNEKHHEAIEELFRMIVDVGENTHTEQQTLLEKNITYYTDYRSYLSFDLIVTDQQGEQQRLSKTLLKKSGGETQTPFYLSVLASFAHMYRIKHIGSSSETIRLIVFDEAFSKMDQQRIEESLKLLRKFDLQAIISAPPDKIVDITPHVDQNLCVFRRDNISFVKSFEKKELMALNS